MNARILVVALAPILLANAASAQPAPAPPIAMPVPPSLIPAPGTLPPLVASPPGVMEAPTPSPPVPFSEPPSVTTPPSVQEPYFMRRFREWREQTPEREHVPTLEQR